MRSALTTIGLTIAIVWLLPIIVVVLLQAVAFSLGVLAVMLDQITAWRRARALRRVLRVTPEDIRKEIDKWSA